VVATNKEWRTPNEDDEEEEEARIEEIEEV